MAGKVLVTDYAWADLEVEKAVLKEIDVELIEAPDGEEATLTGLAGGVCGILTCWAQTTRRVIEAALPDLRGDFTLRRRGGQHRRGRRDREGRPRGLRAGLLHGRRGRTRDVAPAGARSKSGTV